MKLILAVCLLFLVQVITAQERRCEAPREFEANVHIHDYKHDHSIHQRLYYDAWRRRTRHIDEMEVNGTRQYVDVLRLYETEKEYVIDMKTKECHTNALKYHFRPFEIPSEAKYNGEYWIGAESRYPGTGILVAEWGGETSDKARYFNSWTREGCIPIHDGYDSESTGYISTRFYDVEFFIRDPNVFTVPKECM